MFGGKSDTGRAYRIDASAENASTAGCFAHPTLSWPPLAERLGLLSSALSTSHRNVHASRCCGDDLESVIAFTADHSRYLSAIIAAMPDLVSMSGADGRMLYMNAAGRRLIGIGDDADITAIDHKQLCPDWFLDRMEREWLPQAIRDGASSGEGAIRTLDGREIPVTFVLHVHRAADGSIEALSMIARNITPQTAARLDHRGLELQLRRSEQRFRALVEQAPFSVQVLDARGRTLQVNPAWERLWGATLDTIANYNILDDRQLEARGVLPLIRRAFAGEVVHIPAIEYDPDQTIPHSSSHDDPRRWVSAVAYPLKDSESRVREVVLVHEDVTARTRAERALRESDEQFRLMADTMPQLTWMARADGHIFWYNRRWYEYTGTTPADMEGWGWQRVHDPEVLPRVLERWKASIASGEPFEMVFPLRGADGCLRPFLTRVNPLKDERGAVTRWFGTNTDINEQKRAEDAAGFLADAGARLASVADYQRTLQEVADLSVPRFADWCAIEMVELDGSLKRVAAAHVDPDKLETTDDLVRRLSVHPHGAVSAARVALHGRSVLMTTITEQMLGPADGQRQLGIPRTWGLRSLMCVPMKTADTTLGVISFAATEPGSHFGAAQLYLAEQLAGRVAIAIENARLYAELRDADRRKNEFLAMLAHELRNPLAPIRTSLHVLRTPGVDGALVNSFYEIMERQVHHMVRLVDDLLDVSRVMRAKVRLRREAVPLDTAIAHAIDTARPALDAQGHHLTVSVATPTPVVDADPVRLGQVIGNLLTNAAKYTSPGGRIEIRAAVEHGQAVICVVDNGIGIAPALLPRVFELFVQGDDSISRGQGGLGIGLTLVKNIVELHGGTVVARSDGAGKGSEFTVRLPLATPASELPTTPHQSDSRQPGDARRILVVDDNVDGAEALAMMLRLMGHSVYVAHNGPSAISAARTFDPDLVLLDLGLPGMDGYQVARELRKLTHTAPMRIVAVTGWGQEQDRVRTAEAGFDAHLVKPVEPAAILQNIRPASSAL